MTYEDCKVILAAVESRLEARINRIGDNMYDATTAALQTIQQEMASRISKYETLDMISAVTEAQSIIDAGL